MVLMGGVPQTEPGNPGLGPRRRIVSRGLTGIFANREQWRFYRDTLGMISERAGVEGKVCPLTLFGLFRCRLLYSTGLSQHPKIIGIFFNLSALFDSSSACPLKFRL